MTVLGFSFLALTLFSTAWGLEVLKEKGVFVLEEDTFSTFVKENKFVLVEFYAPWCDHCKDLEPEYSEAALALEKQNSIVKLAKVDAVKQTILAEKFDIGAYPTLKWFNDGIPVAYHGPNKAQAIIEYAQKRSEARSLKIDNVDLAKKMISDNQVVLFGVFSNLESDEAQTFARYAEGNDDAEFAMTNTKEVREYLKATDKDVVVLLKKYDEGRNEYTGPLTIEDLEDFLRAYSLPMVMEFTEETQDKIFAGDVEHHMLLLIKFSSPKYNESLRCLTEAAKDLRGKMLAVTVDLDKEDSENILGYFTLEGVTEPRLLIVRIDEATTKFLYKEEINCQSFAKFGKDFLDGLYKPWYASQPIIDGWDSKPLKTLVGKNYQEVTNNPYKHVFVKLYAPWCGHCSAMAPAWEKLAETFQDNDNIVIAEMDATKNEAPNLNIEGFPTIKVYPKIEAGKEQEVLEYGDSLAFDVLKNYVEAISKGERPTPIENNEQLNEEEGKEEGDEEDDNTSMLEDIGDDDSTDTSGFVDDDSLHDEL